MQQTLLSTKFNIPTLGQRFVLRTRLIDTLAQARAHRITLVSAPPGYGKTALVNSWLRNTDFPFTWLSLDEGDNDPVRFLEYFLTALHAVVPAIRLDLLDLRQGSQAASFETLMALLINEAAGVEDFFVVLDDFQALHAAPILNMLGYLLEHLPSQMHMVLISRSDPRLALPRLRARGQLLEIRAEQLRFTAAEIAQFFDEVMHLPLSASDVLALETRTEGWIAGLQLAGLAMQAGSSTQDEEDLKQFIVAFTGSHAYIMDYLTEEVLRRQPDLIRSFLLQTSILDRMCGPLCEAVVQWETPAHSDCQVILETIERNHLFVVPLDAERRWFRYHHLFKEVLSRRLEVLYPGQITALHSRASEWFEQHRFIHEAVQHAKRAGDLDRIVRLVEQYGCALLMGGELVTLADWLAAIDAYTHTRPWLAMQKAWVLALNCQADRPDLAIRADGVINEGEQLISTLALTDEVRTLRGSFAAARALWANTQGKTDLAAANARHAIELLSNGNDFSCALRSVATSLLGDANWAQGNLEEAGRAYTEAVHIGRIAENPHMTMMSMISLADVHYEKGQLHLAASLYAETLQIAKQVDGPNSSYAQGVHFGLSKVLYACNRLEDAAVSVEQARLLSDKWENLNLQVACSVLNTQLDLAKGCVEKAKSTAVTVEEQIRELSLSPSWLLWIRTELARFWTELGKIEKALFLLQEAGVFQVHLTPETLSLNSILLNPPIPFRHVPAYLVLARLYLKNGDPDAALKVIECLMQEASALGWGKYETELLILQALALKAKKDTAASLAAFGKAVTLAWAEQSKRVFLDEGEAAAKLLYQAKAHGIGGEFVAELLSCMGQPLQQEHLADTEQPSFALSQKTSLDSEAGLGQNLLVEPLSARELEVLRCIAAGYSNQEIADRFVLSPLTVKRHISNIYAKLEAKNRTQAVSLARTLKLLD